MKECLKKLNGKDLQVTEIIWDSPKKKKIMVNPAQVSLSLVGKFLAALNSMMYMLHVGADYIVERVFWFPDYSSKSQKMSTYSI